MWPHRVWCVLVLQHVYEQLLAVRLVRCDEHVLFGLVFRPNLRFVFVLVGPYLWLLLSDLCVRTPTNALARALRPLFSHAAARAHLASRSPAQAPATSFIVRRD